MQAVFESDLEVAPCENTLSFLKHREYRSFRIGYYAQFLESEAKEHKFMDVLATMRFNINDYAWALQADEMGYLSDNIAYLLEHYVFGACVISEGFTNVATQDMFGRLFYTDGRVYEGGAVHGAEGTYKQGHGILTYPDGSIEKGLWANNELTEVIPDLQF